MKQSTDSNNNKIEKKSNKQYFTTNVNPIFSLLMYSLIKNRPEDLMDFCIRWFKDSQHPNDSDDSDDNGDLFQDVPDKQFNSMKRKKLQNSARRVAVCSEVYGPFHRRGAISLRKRLDLTDENTEMRILFLFMNSFLFSDFNEGEKKILMENMSERKVLAEQEIIKQGQKGNQMYFVVEGQFQCLQNTSDTVRRGLKIYKAGDIFGQLCILHNAVRLTTIKATTDGFLYCLDREVYRHIKKLSIVKKRSIYTETMKKVNIFENFERDQMQKICDVLTQVVYEAGRSVIIQGDTGNKFYIVLEGVLVAQKGSQQTVSQCFKQGDYFGQLALLHDLPRQATVKTITKCVLVYLTQGIFKRIINRQKIQKLIALKYNKTKKNIMVKKRGGQDKV